MKMYKYVLFVLAILIMSVGGTESVFAQKFQAELDFQLGFPQNRFKTQIDNKTGVGVGGRFGYRIGDTPFVIGLDLGFMNFGTESREEPLSPTIPELRVRVENSYNLFHGHLLLRLMPGDMAVRPYIDGLFGLNYFSTETVLKERGGFGGGDEILRDTNFKDTALSYGFGAGAHIKVYSGSYTRGREDVSFPYTVGINLMSRYLFGNEAEYLKPGSIIRENGTVRYDVSKSTTDILYFQLGVVVNF